MLYLVIRRDKYHLVSSPTKTFDWHVGGDYSSTGAIARRAGIFQMSDVDEEIVVSFGSNALISSNRYALTSYRIIQRW